MHVFFLLAYQFKIFFSGHDLLFAAIKDPELF